MTSKRSSIGIWPRPAEWLCFGALLALWIYECAVLLQPELRFTADSERDMFHIFGLARHGILPADGIRVAALGIDLGPLYFFLVAPFVAMSASPMVVFGFNIGVGVLGLTAFWLWLRTESGPLGAFIACVLYSQSSAHVAMIDTIWHVGAAPGFALMMLAAMGIWARKGRPWALISGGVLLAVLAQIHILGASYIPAACVLLWMGRRHLTFRRLLMMAVAVAITLLPFIIYAIGSLGDAAEGAARHSSGDSFDFAAVWSLLFAFVQPRYLFGPAFTGVLVLVLAVSALVLIFFSIRFKSDASRAEPMRLTLIRY